MVVYIVQAYYDNNIIEIFTSETLANECAEQYSMEKTGFSVWVNSYNVNECAPKDEGSQR